MVTCQDGLAPIKSHELLITLSFGIMWQTKRIISPLTQWLSTPNLAGWWITARGFYPLQPHDSFNMWTTWSYVAIWKIYIYPSIILMAINIDKVLTPGRSFSTQTLKSWPASCLIWGPQSFELFFIVFALFTL